MDLSKQDLLTRPTGLIETPARSDAAAKQAVDPKVRALAEEFEAMFLSQMLAPMFENLQSDGPFGGGSSEVVYRSLMVQEYGNAIAEAGGIGIAEAVQREILKIQEIE